MLGELIDLISGIAHGRAGRQGARTCSAASTNISSAASPAPKASAAASSTRRARSCACWSRCWSPTRAASMTPAAARAACSCSRRNSSRAMAAGIGDIAIYGQESNYTTWRLCKMNLAVRGIDADIRWNNEGSFHKDELQGPALRLHPRQSALQHLRLGRRPAARGCALEIRRAAGRQRQLSPGCSTSFWHLAPNGTAGVVLANGSMSSAQSGEDVIRRAMVEADVVDCMVALPGQLFYSTQIPACLWFLARNKNARRQAARPARRGAVHRRPQARHAGGPHAQGVLGRGHRQDCRDLPRMARGQRVYADVPGFCKAASWRRSGGTTMC